MSYLLQLLHYRLIATSIRRFFFYKLVFWKALRHLKFSKSFRWLDDGRCSLRLESSWSGSVRSKPVSSRRIRSGQSPGGILWCSNCHRWERSVWEEVNLADKITTVQTYFNCRTSHNCPETCQKLFFHFWLTGWKTGGGWGIAVLWPVDPFWLFWRKINSKIIIILSFNNIKCEY